MNNCWKTKKTIDQIYVIKVDSFAGRYSHAALEKDE